MIDSPGHEKGVLVKLGNKNIMAPTGVAAMALRTGAKIIPCNLVRIRNTKFQVMIGKPVQYNPSGNLVEDARELTQNTVRALEEMARNFADQWYIFHTLIKDDVISSEKTKHKTEEADLVNP
jgi:lauroyl/myristoyl acyltransferase